jgi:hypothetical protein
MRALAMTVANPFDPLGSRSVQLLRRPRRIRSLAPRTRAPFVALLNGKPILRQAWRRKLRHGDQVVFCILPRGGGGGGGGSNPLRTILSLGLLAFAPWAAGALLGQAAGTVLFGSFTLGAATTLGITLAGNLLINALLPSPRPGVIPGASPTYSLTAQGNTARVEQAIPVQYGRLLSYPDFAAQPYTEYAGDEQYLYQLLCLGAGDYDVEEIRIEDTPVAAFAEITTQVVPPGARVTLFPTNVITSVEVSGQELAGRTSGTWARSGTTVTVTETGHGRATGQTLNLEFTTGGGPNGVYEIVSVPTANTYTVTTATGAGSGAVLVRPVIGGIDGFVASAAGTVAERLAVDIILPRGLYGTGSGGTLTDKSLSIVIEARQVDDSGAPIGSWITLGSETFTDRTTTPVRRSLSYTLLTAGRYRVRAWRTDVKSAASGDGHEVLLGGLRAYLSDDEDFGAVTIVAMRMRATNNLSLQASRKVGIIATRKIPVWNGTTWSAPVASRSIAWAIADAARDTDYGAALSDQRLDLAALLALDAEWTARGDRFDGRFDQAASWWEAVSRIAGAGRARLFMQGGILRVVRDGPVALPVALYSMRNITRGSFSIDYLLSSEETADAVEVSYFDETTWQPQRVTARLPGSLAAKPQRIDLFGVTSRAHAQREGLYHAAANRYRRRIVRFATEMEGFIPSIGDLIAIQHDSPGWGAHAEAEAWSAGTRILRLTEPMTFGAGSHYIGFRTANGGLSGPWAVTPGPSPFEVVLAEVPDVTPETGEMRERSHVVFGQATTWRTLAKVALVRPRGLYDVEIEAVTEDPSVHTADEGSVAPPIRTSNLPRRVTQPVVTGLLARRVPNDATRALFAWNPAPDATNYHLEMAEGLDPFATTVSWTRVADTTASNSVQTLLYAARTMIRLRGIGLAAGPWQYATLGSLIIDMWNTDATLMWTADANLMWSS